MTALLRLAGLPFFHVRRDAFPRRVQDQAAMLGADLSVHFWRWHSAP